MNHRGTPGSFSPREPRHDRGHPDSGYLARRQQQEREHQEREQQRERDRAENRSGD